MNGLGTLTYRPATDADVLAWLNADYRLRAGIDPEVDAGMILRPETTIAEWRSICDLVNTGRLASIMHEWFGVARPAWDWEAILEPEDERTLADLARFVSPYMTLPGFSSIRVSGTEDKASGAFFCLRSLLANGGVPVERIRPSTVIATLDRSYVLPLGDALARLAPEITPEPRIVARRRQRVGGWLALLGFILALHGLIRAVGTELGLALILVLVGALLGAGPPAAVEFGSFRTFGDLARAIANQREAAT